jgi:hypothetical protein
MTGKDPILRLDIHFYVRDAFFMRPAKQDAVATRKHVKFAR